MQTADFMLQKAIRLARLTPREAAPLPSAALDEVEAVESAPDLAPAATEESWVDRQKRLNPPPKAYWFSIVDEIAPVEPPRPRIEQIQRAVAEFYGVSRNDLLTARRTADIVRPRQVAMFMAKSLTLRSLPEIGRQFGGRDHTTVLHAVRKIAALVGADSQLFAEVEAIKNELGAAQ